MFAPVILGAGALFFVLGQLAVATHDAATWIYGDGVTSSQERSLSLVRWTGQSPWLRATLLLTLFALLERVVRISTDPQQRERVFGRNEAAIRQRLAVMLVDGRSTA